MPELNSIEKSIHPDLEFTSLVELLRYRAVNQFQQHAFTFLTDGETNETHLAYGELDRRARAIAGWLQNRGAIGERILLLYPAGLDYISAFFGCLYAGSIAVPVYPPRFNRPDARLQAIVKDSQATFVLTDERVLTKLKQRLGNTPELSTLQWLATDTLAFDFVQKWEPPAVDKNNLAFLQYTSGSTASPKGVMVNHGNLLHNLELNQLATGLTSVSRGVSWLPFFHDLGLITGILLPVYSDFPITLMAPFEFLQNPFSWLQAISRIGATHSGAPDFAYKLCADRILPEQRLELDLSAWEVAFTGAEPVRLDTLNRFAEIFEPCGFRREVLMACYGLAETTLGVSWSARTTFPVVSTVSGEGLRQNKVMLAAFDKKDSKSFVGCGRAAKDMKVIVVDPETAMLCKSNEIGEIWVSGPSVSQGYWNNPEETDHTFRAYLADTDVGPFLRTGDLGFLENGELFITGRIKDLIIIRGRNHYPQDIELIAEQSHFALQPGSSAAFSIDVDDEEQVAIVCEVKRQHRKVDVNEVARAVREAVAKDQELQVYAIVLVKVGTILKTTSGKIQRRANKQRFLNNDLDEIGRSILGDVLAEVPRKADFEDDSIAPLTPTEAKLAEIWAEVLQVEQVGRNDNFFASGGHSLLATQLYSRIRESFQVEFPLHTIFEFPTLAGLAGKLDEVGAVENLAHVPPIQPVSREKALPLSFSQERMWFLYQFEPNNVAYHVPVAIRLVGALNIAAMERSFNELVRRHEVLRTAFPNVAGRPVQVITPTLSLTVPTIDLQTYPQAEREGEVRRLATKLASEPFDMARGPLLRITLFQMGAEEYVVLVVMHHIISDVWSLGLSWQEMAALYTAFVAEEPSPLLDLPLQSADFAHWQRQSIPDAYFEKQLTYWQQQLAGAPLVLELPTDRRRPAVQTSHGSYQTLPLAPSLLESLRRLGREEDATLFMTLLAAFNVLLYHYTGQEDILVGTPIANRHWLAVEKLMGSFVNTLVMRTDLSGNPTFRDLVKRVREVALAAYDHQDLPFEHLVEVLQPERNLSYPPLIQVMFNVANPPLPVVQLPDLTWQIFEFDRGAAQFDLSISLVDTKQIQMMTAEYNTDLFDHSTIERMMSHFQVLLENIVTAGTDQHLSDLPILSKAEGHKLLVEWNETVRDYPADACVHQLFETQAERTPNAIAITFAEDQFTYNQLNRRANQLAHYLQHLGVGPDVGVGICMDRSLDMVVGVLGILKAGGAYVPLAPSYPQQRLTFMLEDSGASVLLTQQHLLKNFPHHEIQTICIDIDGQTISNQSEQNPEYKVSSENLAYLIYTSGSTGKPKGVEISHKAVVNFLLAMQIEPGLTDRDTLLAVTSLSFDIAVLEIFLPLITGAHVVLVSRAEAADGTKLIKKLAKSQATVMQATPATWQLLLQAGWRGSDRLKILCGGEALSRELADQLRERSACLWNMYGPTETTVWSTTYRVEVGHGPVPIGRPLANSQTYVLDTHLHPVPVGVPGELYLGGDGLARGYHNRPHLTAEKFVKNPFSDQPNNRLYKTGDLARYLPDGNIEFLGRLDYQVKLRGFRIELGEIENVLTRHPSVDQAVVLARETDLDPADKQLVAYVVCHQETPFVAGELREFLLQELPDYMVPAVFVPMDALPLTPNGKINRLALPKPVWDRSNLEQEFIAPATEIEEIVAQIWSQVLGIDKVGARDNYFELGGHSLLVTQVMTRVNEAFQLNLPLRTFFEAPTISEQAVIIEERLIAEIDELTDEQAEQLLKDEELR